MCSNTQIQFRFIVDCLDFAFFTITIILLVITVIMENKQEGELKKTTIIDICIMVVCLGGVSIKRTLVSRIFAEKSSGLISGSRKFKVLRIFQH